MWRLMRVRNAASAPEHVVIEELPSRLALYSVPLPSNILFDNTYVIALTPTCVFQVPKSTEQDLSNSFSSSVAE